ncbi:MAG TPA: hypothetical protein VMW17_04835 [Candidatus Binatia bacterium]|nr:hypothetical protein [Candidatus Binatia bacterium]
MGGDATKQFVEIQMTAGGQTVVANSALAAFDAGGNYISDVLVMPTNLMSVTAGGRLPQATQSTQLFGAVQRRLTRSNDRMPTDAYQYRDSHPDADRDTRERAGRTRDGISRICLAPVGEPDDHPTVARRRLLWRGAAGWGATGRLAPSDHWSLGLADPKW